MKTIMTMGTRQPAGRAQFTVLTVRDVYFKDGIRAVNTEVTVWARNAAQATAIVARELQGAHSGMSAERLS